MTAGEQGVNVMKSFRELVQDDDEDLEADEEEIAAMTEEQRNVYERKARGETVQSVLRANHFLQITRKSCFD